MSDYKLTNTQTGEVLVVCSEEEAKRIHAEMSPEHQKVLKVEGVKEAEESL